MMVHRFWLLTAVVAMMAVDAAYPHEADAVELRPTEAQLWVGIRNTGIRLPVPLCEPDLHLLRMLSAVSVREERKVYVH